jgi:hypothetical protein
MVDNVRNEVVTIHRPQVLKMLCRYLSQLIVSLKNTGSTIILALTARHTPIFTGWNRTSWVRCGFCELQ